VIRHVPHGRGHPYLVEPDQRVPPRPVAGEPVELRVTAPAGTAAPRLELGDSLIETRSRGAAVPDVRDDYGVPAPRVDEGHLGEAVARLGEQPGRESWSAVVQAPPHGEALRYRFVAGEAVTDWFEVRSCGWEPAPGMLRLDGPDELHDRLVAGSVERLTDGERSYRLRFALRLDPGERVVGFGERFDGLDQRGRLVDVAVFDQYKGQGARTYLPMPFAVVAGGGLGFHLDTARRAFFDVGRTREDRLAVEVDLEPGETDVALTLRLFAGEPAEVVRAFADRPVEEPPDWVYRLWMSGNEWNSQARVLAEVERSLAEGIPVGAVVIEAWSDEQTFVAFNDAEYEPHPDGAPHRLADFTFPPDGRWPDPKGMVDRLHGQDVRVLLWQIPLVESDEGQAGHDRRTMVERGYAVRLRDGEPYRNRGWWFPGALMPDFTNPEAKAWWLAKRRYLVEEVGVDGFKTDGGEHGWGADLVYADGSHGGETNNRFPVLYAAAYHELLRACGREPVTFSRAGFTGAGAFPCHWAGDEDSTWEAFRASISAGLTVGVSGVAFWAWDLAGFSGVVPGAELYLRATAMAALSPIMQYHSEFNHHRSPCRDRTPWNVAERTGDARVLPLFRRFARLRERLVPYLAAEGRSSLERGLPLMRALFLAYPQDERVWSFPEQYLLGDALLVAPVTAPGVERVRVLLPAGDWVDPWSGEQLAGGGVVERDAPLDRIPVFVDSARADELVERFHGLDEAAPPPRPILEVTR
jgi:alpha-glucosidase (family GH31 glycosyl hydrolase)